MSKMSDQVKKFLASESARNLAEGSLDLYRHALGELVGWLRTKNIYRPQKITTRRLDDWVTHLHELGLSDGVRQSRVMLIKRFFAWLTKRGELLTDPSASLELPKVKSPLPPVPPSYEELSRLLDSMPMDNPVQVKDRALLETLYGCCLRLSEAVGLDVNDVDTDGCLLKVRKGKGGKGRVVPIPRQTAEILNVYLEQREKLLRRKPTNKALFVSLWGKRITKDGIHFIFGKLRRDAGLKRFHPHLLRHAGADHMLRGGGELRHVQELLGHSDPQTTKGYLRLVPSDLKKAYHAAFPVLRV
jgi:site-specific recombinase XerD